MSSEPVGVQRHVVAVADRLTLDRFGNAITVIVNWSRSLRHSNRQEHGKEASEGQKHFVQFCLLLALVDSANLRSLWRETVSEFSTSIPKRKQSSPRSSPRLCYRPVIVRISIFP